MLKLRSLYTALILGFLLTAVVHADLIPISKHDSEIFDNQTPCNHQDCQCALPLDSFEFHSTVNKSYPLYGQTSANQDINDSIDISQSRNLTVLEDEPSSLIFCLSALMGMGIFGSAHWLKKHSLGFIPEWYHSGGPDQIGHSFAASPNLNLLNNTPAPYFIEPFYSILDSIEKNHLKLKIIVSLWRKSQFTPAVLASRGPPDMS